MAAGVRKGFGPSFVSVFSLELSRLLRRSPELGMAHALCSGMQTAKTPAANLAPAALDLPTCDTDRRFVRVIEQRADGLVAFEFAIGWPELSVELLLPAPAFAEFCAKNQVQRLDH